MDDTQTELKLYDKKNPDHALAWMEISQALAVKDEEMYQDHKDVEWKVYYRQHYMTKLFAEKGIRLKMTPAEEAADDERIANLVGDINVQIPLIVASEDHMRYPNVTEKMYTINDMCKEAKVHVVVLAAKKEANEYKGVRFRLSGHPCVTTEHFSVGVLDA